MASAVENIKAAMHPAVELFRAEFRRRQHATRVRLDSDGETPHEHTMGQTTATKVLY